VLAIPAVPVEENEVVDSGLIESLLDAKELCHRGALSALVEGVHLANPDSSPDLRDLLLSSLDVPPHWGQRKLLPSRNLAAEDSACVRVQKLKLATGWMQGIPGHKFRLIATLQDQSVRSKEFGMDRGHAFLKSQVSNAVVQHAMLLRALEDHENQADDLRFRDLCSHHISHIRENQRMLEEYQSQLGAEVGGKKDLSAATGTARELADAARGSDFVRLVGDIALARQSEDTFKTFREAGRMMGNRTLQEIGEVGERYQDAFVKEANRLAQHLFVEYSQGIDGGARRVNTSHLEANP
jgi:hypothetical protein